MVGFAQTTADPPLGVKFVSAGMAGCIGDMITFPLDVAKVRLQIQGEGAASTAATHAVHHLSPGTAAATAAPTFKYKGMVGTLLTISREEGPRALYNGIIPGLQRQICFCSVRIGMYDAVKGAYINAFNRAKKDSSSSGASQNVFLRILAGITTGGLAVMCAQPTDVVKVRMQAQTGGPRYKGSIDAYKTIARTEGVKGLWKGVIPNVTRNAIVNATELVSYDLIKEAILHYRLLSDNMPCHFVSAFGAGFCTTVMASPVDVVKTRYMNSAPGVYTGAVNCAIKMYNEGGPMAFYKGFVPSFIRLGSWNIVMFVCFEQLKRGFMQISYFQPEIKSTQPPPFVHCRMDL